MLVSTKDRDCSHIKVGDKVLIAHCGATISNSLTVVEKISRTHITTVRSRYLAPHRFLIATGKTSDGSRVIVLEEEAQKGLKAYKEGARVVFAKTKYGVLYVGEGGI